MVWRVGLSSTVSAIIASPVAASSAATAQPSSACAQLNQNSLPRSTASDHTGSTALRTRRSPSAELVGHRRRWRRRGTRRSRPPQARRRRARASSRTASSGWSANVAARPSIDHIAADGAGTGDRHRSLGPATPCAAQLELARPAPERRRARPTWRPRNWWANAAEILSPAASVAATDALRPRRWPPALAPRSCRALMSITSSRTRLAMSSRPTPHRRASATTASSSSLPWLVAWSPRARLVKARRRVSPPSGCPSGPSSSSSRKARRAWSCASRVAVARRMASALARR